MYRILPFNIRSQYLPNVEKIEIPNTKGSCPRVTQTGIDTYRVDTFEWYNTSTRIIMELLGREYLDYERLILPETEEGTYFRVKRHGDVLLGVKGIKEAVKIQVDVTERTMPQVPEFYLALSHLSTMYFTTSTPHPEGLVCVYREFSKAKYVREQVHRDTGTIHGSFMYYQDQAHFVAY
jgi:hypothetical protein